MDSLSFVHLTPHSSENISACDACESVAQSEYDEYFSYKNPLSLDALFVQHPHTTYFVRVGAEHTVITESTYLGVRTGDILIIDRSLTPTLGALVLATHKNELMLCRYIEHENRRYLVSGGSGKDPEKVCLEDDVSVWGVVSALSRHL